MKKNFEGFLLHPLWQKKLLSSINHTFVSEYFFGEPDLARLVYFLLGGGPVETFAGFGGCAMSSVESRSIPSGSIWPSMIVFNGWAVWDSWWWRIDVRAWNGASVRDVGPMSGSSMMVAFSVDISFGEARDSSRNLLHSSIEKICWLPLNLKPHLNRISKECKNESVLIGYLMVFSQFLVCEPVRLFTQTSGTFIGSWILESFLFGSNPLFVNWIQKIADFG